jgi:hypothetical protein
LISDGEVCWCWCFSFVGFLNPHRWVSTAESRQPSLNRDLRSANGEAKCVEMLTEALGRPATDAKTRDLGLVLDVNRDEISLADPSDARTEGPHAGFW